MTEVQLPPKRPATDPKKVKAAILIATVATIGTGAAFLSASKTSVDIANATTSVAETTLPFKTVQYQVGTVGVVSVVDDGTSLSVSSITPLTGWAVFSIEQADGSVSVLFKSLSGEVTFVAAYQNGTVTTSVSATNIFQVPVTAKPVYPVVTPTTVKRTTPTTVKQTTTTIPTTSTTVEAEVTTTSTTTTIAQTTTTVRRRHDD